MGAQRINRGKGYVPAAENKQQSLCRQTGSVHKDWVSRYKPGRNRQIRSVHTKCASAEKLGQWSQIGSVQTNWVGTNTNRFKNNQVRCHHPSHQPWRRYHCHHQSCQHCWRPLRQRGLQGRRSTGSRLTGGTCDTGAGSAERASGFGETWNCWSRLMVPVRRDRLHSLAADSTWTLRHRQTENI